MAPDTSRHQAQARNEPFSTIEGRQMHGLRHSFAHARNSGAGRLLIHSRPHRWNVARPPPPSSIPVPWRMSGFVMTCAEACNWSRSITLVRAASAIGRSRLERLAFVPGPRGTGPASVSARCSPCRARPRHANRLVRFATGDNGLPALSFAVRARRGSCRSYRMHDAVLVRAAGGPSGRRTGDDAVAGASPPARTCRRIRATPCPDRKPEPWRRAAASDRRAMRPRPLSPRRRSGFRRGYGAGLVRLAGRAGRNRSRPPVVRSA